MSPTPTPAAPGQVIRSLDERRRTAAARSGLDKLPAHVQEMARACFMAGAAAMMEANREIAELPDEMVACRALDQLDREIQAFVAGQTTRILGAAGPAQVQ